MLYRNQIFSFTRIISTVTFQNDHPQTNIVIKYKLFAKIFPYPTPNPYFHNHYRNITAHSPIAPNSNFKRTEANNNLSTPMNIKNETDMKIGNRTQHQSRR